MFFGATSALLPLRLAHFGAPAWEIGVVFVAASALSTVLSPFVGRSVDRRGPRSTIVAGLATGVPLVAALAFPHDALALGLLIVVALGAPMTGSLIPAVSLMTDATERAAVTLLIATTAVNLAYAVGETIGAPAAAGLSTVAGDALPLLLIAAVLLATLVLVLRTLPQGAGTNPPAGDPDPIREGGAPPAALHTGRGSSPGDPERRARRGDRRRADRADRPPPVRLGTEAPSLRPRPRRR